MLGRARHALGTLRWRLTLTFVSLLVLLLAGLGAYQYVTLQRSLVDSRAQSLRGDVLEATVLLQRLLPARTALRTEARIAAVAGALCASRGTQSGADVTGPALDRAFACAVSVASGHTVSVVVYDRALLPVAVAGERSLDRLPQLDDTTLAAARDGGSPPGQILDAGGENQLVVAFPIGTTVAGLAAPAATPSPGSDAGTGTPVPARAVAQLSTTTAPIDDVLAGERERLAIGGLVVLVAAMVASLLLTGRALAPLRRLAATAGELAGGNLRARSRLAPRDDEVGRLAASFDDMADSIEAAFAVRAESEARMRRFVADASHELRTPITALKGYVDVMRRGAITEPGAMGDALATMGREADRMRALVLDLLTLARIDARPEAAPVEPVDMVEVVRDVLDHGVPGMPPSLRRDLDEPPVVVAADRNTITTVALNLLSNACTYAPGAPQRWSVHPEDGRAVLTVSDQGPGIAAADLPHVFERFYRGEKTRARQEGGTGLGLSIVQGLARSRGGDVAVESEEGRGTTFRVWFPLAQGGDAASGAPAAEGESAVDTEAGD